MTPVLKLKSNRERDKEDITEVQLQSIENNIVDI